MKFPVIGLVCFAFDFQSKALRIGNRGRGCQNRGDNDQAHDHNLKDRGLMRDNRQEHRGVCRHETC